MIAAWSRARVEFRTSWRAVIAISLVVAFGAGVALTAAAGARRTQTAMRRFLAYNRPEDATVFFATTPQVGRRVVALPQVARWMQLPYLYMSTDPSKFDPRTGVFGAEDAAALHTIERPLVVRGRPSRPDRVNEVMVNEREVAALHLHVGSSFTLYAFSLRQTLSGGNTGFTGPTRPEGPRYRVRVVGVVREPTDITVVPDTQNVIYESSGTVYATPALVANLAHTFGESANQLPGSEIVRIQFRHGAADLPAFTKAAVAIAGNKIQILPGSDVAQAAGAVQHGVGVEAIALWLFAVVAALTTLLVFSLNVTRILRAELPDHRRLWQLGMSRRQLAAVSLARPFVIAVTWGVLAVALAIVASPLTPIGLARQAEIHRGVAMNAVPVAAGFGHHRLRTARVGLVVRDARAVDRGDRAAPWRVRAPTGTVGRDDRAGRSEPGDAAGIQLGVVGRRFGRLAPPRLDRGDRDRGDGCGGRDDLQRESRPARCVPARNRG